MPSTTTVKYSPRAASAIAFLKASINDIDVFVEDTSNRNMWNYFLRKHLPTGVRLSSVTMLGGKEVVIEAARIDTGTSRPTLYIIDGDFDGLLARPKPREKKLFRLDAYCIENLLLLDTAVIDVATSADIELTPEQAASRFSYSSFMERNGPALRFLFAAYAVCHEVAPEEKTIGYNCRSLFLNRKDRVDFCSKKVTARVLPLLRLARTRDPKKFFSTFRKVKHLAREKDPALFCSGKDYLLPPVHISLCKAFGFRGTEEQLKVTLAKSSFAPKNKKLSRAISSAIRSARATPTPPIFPPPKSA